jgi:hypothetical protein
MDRRNFMLAGASLFSALAAAAQGKGASLIVRVSYAGSGTINDSHKIYVALWDSPDFVKDHSGSMEPMVVKPISSKSGSVRFDDVQKNPVYVSMAYDPTGAWQADSPPPAGTSLGLYAKQPGVPAPVELKPGKATTISATFDDSFKNQR